MALSVCCRRFIFLIISIMTMGSTAVLLLLGVIGIKQKNLQTIDNKIIIVLVVSFSIALLLLIYCIIASLCGKRCTNFGLAIVYAIFTAFLVFCGVVVLVYESQLEDMIKKAYSIQSEDAQRIIKAIEEEFKCCGWDTFNISCGVNTQNCQVVFNKFYNDNKIWLAIAFFTLAVILLVGTVVAFHYVCCGDEEDKYRELQTMRSPLVYGR